MAQYQESLQLPGVGTPGTGASANPLSTTAEDALKVSGVGSLLGMAWGPVTVAQAIGGFNALAKKANSSVQSQALLIQIQEEMYAAGLYGSKKPKFGVLTTGEDDVAFRKAMVAAAQSGTKASDYLSNAAGMAQQTGTAGSGTHIIPAKLVPEKVWTPEDILGAVNAATTATGQNLAQRLIGRDFNANELQGAADLLNKAQGAQTAADVAGALQQQQENVTTSQAVYGQPAASVDLAGAAKVTPQQVFQQIIAQGGNTVQAQIGASMVTGFESDGTLNDQNPKSTASGLFQFLDTTWNNYGGVSHAGNATFQQQVAKFIQETAGNNFNAWAPDMGGAYGDGKRWSIPAPGSKVANAIQSLGLNSMAATASKPLNPAPTLKAGRTDQGVDYSGAGNLYPTGAGTIVRVQSSGWGSLGNAGLGALIALKLDNPPDAQHSVVYYAENIIPNVKVGQHVGPGQVIGRATGQGGGIEIGFADPANPTNPLAPLNPNATGAATTEGGNFASWLSTGTISGVGAGGAQGATTDVYQNPVVQQVPADLNPADAAIQYAETVDAPLYQTNNLLKVFQQMKSSLSNPNSPSSNPAVRQTPVSMK